MRPKTTIPFVLRLTPEQHARLRAMGPGQMHRSLIDAASPLLEGGRTAADRIQAWYRDTMIAEHTKEAAHLAEQIALLEAEVHKKEPGGFVRAGLQRLLARAKAREAAVRERIRILQEGLE